MGEHAKFSPSGCDRSLTCTASTKFEQQFPEQETSSFAQEGTDAHDLLERAVKAKTRPSDLAPDHPAAKDVDQCYDLAAPFLDDPNYIVMSEVKVHLCDDCWGTADIIVIGGGKLAVVDYKHGRGVLVELPSLQLEIYGAAALKSLGFLALTPIEEVHTIIVQPRAEHPAGPIRMQKYSVEEMTTKGGAVEAVIGRVNSGDTAFCPSEKACRWCRAKGSCKAQAKMALDAAKSHFKPLGDEGDMTVETPKVDTVGTLSMQEKVAIKEAIKFITTFLTAVDSSIMASLMAGEDVPGLKVVAGRSNRKFGKMDDEGHFVKLSDEEVLETLTKTCKLKMADIAPPKLLGPAPIENLIDVKKRNGQKKLEALKAIIVKPEGKPTVVSEDDARKSIAPHFKPVETDETDPLA